MKTIILYATKNGAAREIAQRIAKKIGDAQVYDLKQQNIPDITKFDCIIIGSSIYAGMIRKEAKTFLAESSKLLHGKKLGLFVSGFNATGEKTYFDSNFSPEILQMSTACSFLGGIFDPKKAGIIGRFIMKMVAKQSAYANNILDDSIDKFVEAMST